MPLGQTILASTLIAMAIGFIAVSALCYQMWAEGGRGMAVLLWSFGTSAIVSVALMVVSVNG